MGKEGGEMILTIGFIGLIIITIIALVWWVKIIFAESIFAGILALFTVIFILCLLIGGILNQVGIK